MDNHKTLIMAQTILIKQMIWSPTWVEASQKLILKVLCLKKHSKEHFFSSNPKTWPEFKLKKQLNLMFPQIKEQKTLSTVQFQPLGHQQKKFNPKTKQNKLKKSKNLNHLFSTELPAQAFSTQKDQRKSLLRQLNNLKLINLINPKKLQSDYSKPKKSNLSPKDKLKNNSNLDLCSAILCLHPLAVYLILAWILDQSPKKNQKQKIKTKNNSQNQFKLKQKSPKVRKNNHQVCSEEKQLFLQHLICLEPVHQALFSLILQKHLSKRNQHKLPRKHLNQYLSRHKNCLNNPKRQIKQSPRRKIKKKRKLLQLFSERKTIKLCLETIKLCLETITLCLEAILQLYLAKNKNPKAKPLSPQNPQLQSQKKFLHLVQ